MSFIVKDTNDESLIKIVDDFEKHHNEVLIGLLGEKSVKRMLSKGVSESAQRELDAFKSEIKETDNVWYFRTPEFTWGMQCGREGYCIIRDGNVVKEYVTFLN